MYYTRANESRKEFRRKCEPSFACIFLPSSTLAPLSPCDDETNKKTVTFEWDIPYLQCRARRSPTLEPTEDTCSLILRVQYLKWQHSGVTKHDVNIQPRQSQSSYEGPPLHVGWSLQQSPRTISPRTRECSANMRYFGASNTICQYPQYSLTKAETNSELQPSGSVRPKDMN